LEDASFWNGLQKLHDDFGIHGPQLCKFMSDSVAARLEDERFWNGLQKLQADFEITPSQHGTLITEVLTSRMFTPFFWEKLTTMRSNNIQFTIRKCRRFFL